VKRVTYILFRQKINVLKNRSQNKYTLHTYFTKHCPWNQKVAISWLGGGGHIIVLAPQNEASPSIFNISNLRAVWHVKVMFCKQSFVTLVPRHNKMERRFLVNTM